MSAQVIDYGNNLIIFDALFGTRCLPATEQDAEQPGLGEHDEHFPQSWWRQLLVPFRWNAMLKIDPTTTITIPTNTSQSQ